ncbi:siroheme synthase [Parendozoicomonas haliclonae]|uniref:precorrin-2 dehydrogenase n=1 Tax=Parendozoicomonas haliclonae TaxID=1960125 RepID=A0A1X7ALL4_9GAMM|nr:NAD(P)-dependent oxidoreductase [Parendozoicomonas haliclonae]SMA48849.1 Siroheme synthase [Parendozoicomonas haliclonae]
MDYLPLFLDVKNQRCLVVGGGDVALRKIRLLHSAGARLRVVAPEIRKEVYAFLSGSHHELKERAFHPDDLGGVALVIASTDNHAVNQQVAERAKQQGVFVNVIDAPEAGNAIVPAIIDRSPVMVAVSTSGTTPVLARLLREQLESVLPNGLGQLAALAGEYRGLVKARFDSIHDRRHFWEETLTSDVAEQVYAAQLEQARSTLEQRLAGAELSSGELYLINVAHNDPDELTFKALRLMQKAETVFYTDDVSKAIMALCRRDADLIAVKNAAEHEALIIEHINNGRRVLFISADSASLITISSNLSTLLANKNVPVHTIPTPRL